MSGIAKDMPTLASFLDALKSDPDVAAAWVGNAQKSKFGTADVYVFTLNAQLSSGARGHRFEQFFGRPACK